MKELKNITEEEVKEICRLVGEPYISFMTNTHGKWTDLAVQIETTSTLHGSKHDSCIWIRNNGTIQLWRNNGDWGGHGYEEINSLPVIDYLRKQGYVFEGSDDSNDPYIALHTATKIIERLIASKPVKNLDEHLAHFKTFHNE